MTLIQGIVTFSLLWWTLIFCVLPFYYQQSETEGAVARPKPKLWKIVVITTVISVLGWLIIYGLIEANVLDFYKLGQDMAVKDGLQ